MKRHSISTDAHSQDLARVTEVFKALSEPVRVQLVLQLSRGERSVNQLVTALDLPQSTVSRHLASLRAAELVQFQRDGASVRYRLADAHLGALLTEAFSHAQHERLGLADHSEKAADEVTA